MTPSTPCTPALLGRPTAHLHAGPASGNFYVSWLNRIEAQFHALRYFALDGTDHETREVQSRVIRRYIVWRNRNAQGQGTS